MLKNRPPVVKSTFCPTLCGPAKIIGNAVRKCAFTYCVTYNEHYYTLSHSPDLSQFS